MFYRQLHKNLAYIKWSETKKQKNKNKTIVSQKPIKEWFKKKKKIRKLWNAKIWHQMHGQFSGINWNVSEVLNTEESTPSPKQDCKQIRKIELMAPVFPAKDNSGSV